MPCQIVLRGGGAEGDEEGLEEIVLWPQRRGRWTRRVRRRMGLANPSRMYFNKFLLFIFFSFFFSGYEGMMGSRRGYPTIAAQAGSGYDKGYIESPPLPHKGQRHSCCHSPSGYMWRVINKRIKTKKQKSSSVVLSVT